MGRRKIIKAYNRQAGEACHYLHRRQL